MFCRDEVELINLGSEIIRNFLGLHRCPVFLHMYRSLLRLSTQNTVVRYAESSCCKVDSVTVSEHRSAAAALAAYSAEFDHYVAAAVDWAVGSSSYGVGFFFRGPRQAFSSTLAVHATSSGCVISD